jgi:hypothetical protein
MGTNKIKTMGKEISRALYLLNNGYLKIAQSKKIFTVTTFDKDDELIVLTLKKENGIWIK